jgi:hypothetical protein
VGLPPCSPPKKDSGSPFTSCSFIFEIPKTVVSAGESGCLTSSLGDSDHQAILERTFYHTSGTEVAGNSEVILVLLEFMLE